MFWLLAYWRAFICTPTFFPPSPPSSLEDWPWGSRIQLQQRNCFRFSRNSFHQPADYDSQRTAPSVVGRRKTATVFLIVTRSLESCSELYAPSVCAALLDPVKLVLACIAVEMLLRGELTTRGAVPLSTWISSSRLFEELRRRRLKLWFTAALHESWQALTE
jgi:hypothetical protein